MYDEVFFRFKGDEGSGAISFFRLVDLVEKEEAGSANLLIGQKNSEMDHSQTPFR